MAEQIEMYRYEIPVWNRDMRPAYIDSIRAEHDHLFLQLLQEKMHVYKSRVYPDSVECFLQIVKHYEKHASVYQLWVVSMKTVGEDDGLRRLVTELIESNLGMFLTEHDWDKRLRENLR